MSLTVFQVCEIAAQCMEHLCNHNWHGYTQAAGTPGRWGDGEGYCTVKVYGKDYKLAQGDRDCSSAIISIFREVLGIPINATYTGNMKEAFLATGLFKWHERNSGYKPGRGVICLNEKNHTALHLGNGMIGEFSIAENGGIYGVTGDQTGSESRIRAYYDYPWDGFLEYTGGNAASGTATQNPVSSAAVPTYPSYRVLTKEDGWLAWVKGLVCSDGCGDDCAGIRGCLIRNAQIKDLGPKGWFRLTMKKQGLLKKNQQNADMTDYVIGVEIYYDTPDPATTGYYKAKYRVAPLGKAYLKWEYDDEDGGAGDGVNGIDRLQLTIAK